MPRAVSFRLLFQQSQEQLFQTSIAFPYRRRPSLQVMFVTFFQQIRVDDEGFVGRTRSLCTSLAMIIFQPRIGRHIQYLRCGQTQRFRIRPDGKRVERREEYQRNAGIALKMGILDFHRFSSSQ